MGKKNELKELHFEESLLLSNSMCTLNHNLFYKWSQLKNTKRIHASGFSTTINMKLIDKGPKFKIY